MIASEPTFYPFYEKWGKNKRLSFAARVLISVSIGALYLVLLLASLSDYSVFYQQQSWVLGAIISFSLLALYITTAMFRYVLPALYALEQEPTQCDQWLKKWLSNKQFLLFGFIFAGLNTGVGHLFGVPDGFYGTAGGGNPYSLITIYAGFYLSGFFCGMAVGGIVGVVAVFEKIAPLLQYSLDYRDPDGCAGTQVFGNALLVFSLVTLLVGVLISVYISGVDWVNRGLNRWVEFLLWLWVIFPYLMALLVLLIPLLSIGFQLNAYKRKLRGQFKSAINELRQGYPDDDELVKEKIQHLNAQLNDIHKMRISPINRESLINFFIGTVPGLIGTATAGFSLIK